MQKAICLQKRDKIQTCKSGSHQFARIGADPKTYFCFGSAPSSLIIIVFPPLKKGRSTSSTRSFTKTSTICSSGFGRPRRLSLFDGRKEQVRGTLSPALKCAVRAVFALLPALSFPRDKMRRPFPNVHAVARFLLPSFFVIMK